jgi:prepilin-type N-terminal cleavage/methylation domain-containing protein
MKKGFTLLELIVVIIILGILATLGTGQYFKMIEKGRTAEAKAILGQIKTAQAAYFLERNTYATSIADLPVGAPNTTCVSNAHYFGYSTTGGATFTATATRCTTNTSKSPPAVAAYSVTLNEAGTWGGDAGYY